MNSNQYLHVLVLLVGLLSNLNESKSIDSSIEHSIQKRQDNKKMVPTLTPTLTVDIGPQSPPMIPFQEDVSEYYFPVNATLFNFTCVIKHPSYRYKMKVTREQEYNNGSKNGPISLFSPEDMELVNPLIQEPRLKMSFDDTSDSPKSIKASFLAYGVQIRDSGIYRCSYSNLNKQIKVTVFSKSTNFLILFFSLISNSIFNSKEQAHQNNVALKSFKSVEINKPVEVTCTVRDVYPKPTITFYSPSQQKVENDLVVIEDVSDKTEAIYSYTLVGKYSYTPKYGDHNKDLNCSVFSFTSSNVTIDSSFKVNIVGTELVSTECKETYHANVDEQDVQIACVFFSNPKVDSEWSTKVLRTSPIVVESTATIDGIQSGTEQSTTDAPVTTMVTQWEETVRITSGDNQESNYDSSVEEYGEPGSGLYRAVIRIKTVREEDFKTYTIRLFGSNNQTVVEQAIKLRKRSECKFFFLIRL